MAIEDPEVRSILLRINSPGGECDGCFETAAFLSEAGKKKPMWAVADVMAYSAAYALASQTAKIYVPPVSGGVGSIGVYALHLDFSGMLEQVGIKPTFITAGEGKVDGNPYQPLSDAAKREIQADVDRLYAVFVGHVSRGRRLSEERIRKTLGAYAYKGSAESIAAGLADVAGSLEDAWLVLATAAEQSAARFGGASSSRRASVGQGSRIGNSVVDDPVAAARVGERDEARRELNDIALVCQMAGHPQLVAGYVLGGTSLAQVRTRLMELAVAEDGEEISNHLAGGTGVQDLTAQKIGGSGLVKACEKLAASMTGGK